MNKELSAPEVAQMLGVTTTSVYQMVERGDLVPSRIEVRGRQTRRFFREDHVEQLRQRRGGDVSGA
jgi:predicted DNA-binding transcriptional regulator AlpA